MKRILLLFSLTLAVITANGQAFNQLTADSLRIGKSNGSTSTAIYGTVRFKNITPGNVKLDAEGKLIPSTSQDFTSAEKSKLAGISPGATANQTDAYLLNRSNHTGTQAISTVTGLQTALDGKISSESDPVFLAQKGAANGVASLNASGKVPNSQIPAIAISETFEVASEAAMLALSAAEQGDIAVRSDINKSFILKDVPASTLSNWVWLQTPTDAVISVNGMSGAVTLASLTGGFGVTLSGGYNASSAKAISADTTVLRTVANSVSLAELQTRLNAYQPALSGTGLLSFSGSTPSYNSTSSSIRSIISDETGTGALVFGTSPTILTGLTIEGGSGITYKGSNGFTSAAFIDGGSNDQGTFRLYTGGAEKVNISADATSASYIDAGTFRIGNLAGTGTRMVVADNIGTLSTQAIPSGGGGGSIVNVGVSSANGFAGTSDGNPTNPTLTLSTTATGLLKGNGTAISAASAGTDYTLLNGTGLVLMSGTTPSYITNNSTNWNTAYSYSQIGHLPLSAGPGNPLTGDLYLSGSKAVISSSSLGTVNTAMQSDNTSGYFGTLSNHPLRLRANSVTAIEISPGGNSTWTGSNGFTMAQIIDGGSNDQGTLRLSTGGVEKVNISADASSDSYIDAGNFGIGDSTPMYKLDVNGTGRFTGALVASNLSGTNTGDQTTITGNAGTATKLQTARNISGVAFDGSADITLNNTGITNGAGYITASSSNTLTNKSGNISQWTNDSGYTTNTGTVTSVAATAGTGISISGSPITSSGTLVITNTAPDQTVSLTAGTGISVSGTYPNFTVTNSAPATTSGTVTSVGVSVPTGLSVSGSPVTSSGTIAIGLQSGYSIPTTANQSAWSAKQDALGYTAENASNKSTSTTLGTSNTLYPTQNAVKTYVDNAVSASSALGGGFEPTFTGVTNISSIVPRKATYTVTPTGAGYIIQVTGAATVTTTSGGGTGTIFRVSLPSSYPYDFTSNYDLSGLMNARSLLVASNGIISADTTNNEALMEFTSNSIVSQEVRYTYSYEIIN